MAQSYRNRHLSVLRQNETALAGLFAQLAQDIGAVVQRRADADGNVSRQATFEIQQQAGDLVRRLFLGRTGRGEWAPFDTVRNGAVIPLSPYMRQVWGAIRAAVRIPIEQGNALLERRLPLDVLATMRQADVNPFAVARQQVREQLFRPNPLAAYEPAHTWVDPNGYRLSDRVWNAAGNTRQRLDAYLEQAIREGRGALQMSRELEQFLIPGRGLRTSKPYGANASFDAMRLARTEISRAAQEAHRMSAAMNPFVRGMKWNLSARHPRIDICDDLARGGPTGDGVYSVEEYPERPHPQCLCYSTNVLIENPDIILDELRADIRRVRADLVDKVGPLLVDQFEKLLLGQGLEVISIGPVGRVIAPAVLPPVTPPVVAPLPSPADRAVQARTAVLETHERYRLRVEALDEQMLPVATELTETTRHIERLEASLVKREGTPQAEQIQAKLVERRLDRERLLNQRRALQGDIDRLTMERTLTLRRLVQVDRPAAVALRTQGTVDAAAQRDWQQGVSAFNNLVGDNVAPTVPARVEALVGRAHYDPNVQVLRLQAVDDDWVMVHELGHWLEDHNPEVHRRAVEFYERRTQGYALEWMGPGYGRDELTRRDKFIDAYMGIEYSAGTDRYATEIVSKGLEIFHRNPARLAAGDPEMFDFIFNLARGL